VKKKAKIQITTRVEPSGVRVYTAAAFGPDWVSWESGDTRTSAIRRLRHTLKKAGR
jgi:hypothetical protein